MAPPKARAIVERVTEAGFQTIRLLGFAAAATLPLCLERLQPHSGNRPSLRTNGALWVIDTLVIGAVCGGCACATARWAASARLGLLNSWPAPFPLALLTTILALDLVSYAWHRANHRFALLWRFHRVHHSDRSFTMTTALRFHPGELLLSLPLRLAAIVAVGAPAAAVVAFEIVFTFSNLLEHGDIDLPARLERTVQPIFVTPALHRRHHSLTQPERDRNFATILSLWDHLGRTYWHSSSAARIAVGLPEVEADLGPAAALALPFSIARRRSPSR